MYDINEVEGLKRMTPEDFLRGGYLQELNRRFLHPLGISLGARHINGQYELGPIFDCREIKDGVSFDMDGDPGLFIDYLYKIEEEIISQVPKRKAHYGWVVQPLFEDGAHGDGFDLPYRPDITTHNYA